MPMVEQYATVDQDAVWDSYDEDMLPFPSRFSTDARLCLQAAAPRPATVLAAIVGVETHDRA